MIARRRGPVRATPPTCYALEDAPRLAAALRGDVVAQRSTLHGPENVDLQGRVTEALEIYVPLTRGDQVIGAYQVYLDLAGVHVFRPVGCFAIVAAFTWLGWLVKSKLDRPAQPPIVPVTPRAAKLPGADITLRGDDLHTREFMMSNHPAG